MDKLSIEATESTPTVNLDHLTDYIEISGESRPEDVTKFYAPVIDWLEQYKNYLFFIFENYPDEKDRTIKIDFKLEYFNSSSAKYLMDLINVFKDMNESISRANFEINWYYEEMDEDMLYAGREFEGLLGIKFNFILVE